MISVILAVYNLEEYIERCILSILKQSYKELELIIVDDGSSDRTGDVCTRYAKMDRRVIYIKKKNEGQGEARNVGLKLAKGEYVTYVDGDDWLETDALSQMYYVAKKEDADIVVGDIWYVYAVDEGYERKYSKIRYENEKVILQGECPEKMSKLRTFTWGKLYRRAFLREEGFRQPSNAYEDTATIPILLLHAQKIVYINVPVYNYLKNRSMSTIYSEEKVLDLLSALQQLYDTFCTERCVEKYEMEIKRLFWGQIRSLCIAHNVSWEKICQEKTDYSELIHFIQKCFKDFIFFDDYDITVRNSVVVEKSLENEGCTIIMKKGGVSKEYSLGKSLTTTEKWSEDQIWDCADLVFALIQGGAKAEKVSDSYGNMELMQTYNKESIKQAEQ